jgi:4-diphosphocytidyl-2-C-methyl-D-erythritol kinase
VIAFPNCKINLGLRVLRKRADGFHDIETVFYPISFYDALEVITSENTHQPQWEEWVRFKSTGLTIEGKPDENLCVKAYHLLKNHFPQLPAIDMHLHKAIPMGAGLGGGSADGAFALQLLNDKYNLNIPKSQLVEFAAMLGSDCPFFIINKPCFASSRGEMLEEIPLPLSGYRFILVNPGIHVNTRWAFSALIPRDTEPSNNLKYLVTEPISRWKDTVSNDFEVPVFEKYPQIRMIKEQLYDAGAVYASMSGSGSTVFGIFDREAQVQFPVEYMTLKIS